MATSKRLQAKRRAQGKSKCKKSMCCSEASRVKTSRLQAKGRGLRGRGQVFGGSSPALLGIFDPAQLSWRMSQMSLIWAEQTLLPRLPRWGMTANGRLYRLKASVQATSGNAGSVLHGYKWATPTARDWKGKSVREDALPNQVEKTKWHTPRANDALKGGFSEAIPRNGLAGQVADLQKKLYLNPEWEEQLMGFPVGWTELS